MTAQSTQEPQDPTMPRLAQEQIQFLRQKCLRRRLLIGWESEFTAPPSTFPPIGWYGALAGGMGRSHPGQFLLTEKYLVRQWGLVCFPG